MILLVSVSCALCCSLALLTPVINKVKKNKQEVLELFVNKKVEEIIDEQLTMCRTFITRFQGAGDRDNEARDDVF